MTSERRKTRTTAQHAYHDRLSAGPCVVCRRRGIYQETRTEIHHRTTGDLHGQKCLGHDYVIALCSDHHRNTDCPEHLGPGLASNKRAFMDWVQEEFGERSTAALQRWQDKQLLQDQQPGESW